MKKKINVVPYDPKWPNIFKVYTNKILSSFEKKASTFLIEFKDSFAS